MDFLRKVVGKLSYCCCRNSFFSKHWRNLDWQCTSIDSFKSTTFKLHQADINFDKLQVCLGIFLRKNTTATCSFLFLFPLPPCCSANLSASFLLLKSKLNHPVPVDLTLSLVCCHSWSKINAFRQQNGHTLSKAWPLLTRYFSCKGKKWRENGQSSLFASIWYQNNFCHPHKTILFIAL